MITRVLPDGTEAKQVTQEALPLSAQDLRFEPDGSTYCSLEISQSVLLRHVEGADRTSSEWLFYDVYYPYTSWSHRLCRRLLERDTDWQPVADGIQVYSYTAPGDDGVNYLLETPDAIIVLYPPDPLDETQLATAISHLSP